VTGGKWGPSPVLGTPGGEVTYSFMPSGTNCFIGGMPPPEPSPCTISALSTFMPSGFEAQIEAAFDAWAAVANITFELVDDDGVDFNAPPTSGHGDIRLGGHVFDGAGGILGHGYFPPPNGNTAAGDIHFDVAETWKIGFGGAGFDIFQVTAHEIGHAIGLFHTGVPGSLMNPSYTEAFSGPQADDIAGARAIYNPEPATVALLGFGLVCLFLTHRKLSA